MCYLNLWWVGWYCRYNFSLLIAFLWRAIQYITIKKYYMAPMGSAVLSIIFVKNIKTWQKIRLTRAYSCPFYETADSHFGKCCLFYMR